MDFKKNLDVNIWKQAFVSSFESACSTVMTYVPQIFAAIIILVIGYLVSKLIRKLAIGLLVKAKVDKLSQNIGLKDLLAKSGLQLTAVQIIGNIIFYAVMLFVLMSTAEALGLTRITQTIHSLLLYVPKLLGAIIIAIIGLFIANFVRTLVKNVSEGIGADYAEAISKLAYAFLILIVGTLAIGELEIEITLLSRVVQIILISSGVALAISLGLGTKDLAQNIGSGVYARERFKLGHQISIGQHEGELLDIGTVNSRLSLEGGNIVFIPNSSLVKSKVIEKNHG